MRYWLMKSEPSVVSIDHLAQRPQQTVDWFGVRNYLARNYLREMALGDLGFFYHSSCPEPGIAGLVTLVKAAYPDPTQFDANDHYFDPKSSPENPRWSTVDVQLVRKTRLLSLAELRATPGLEDLRILQKGNRLSVTPVDDGHARILLGLLG